MPLWESTHSTWEKLTTCNSGDASRHKGSITNHFECPQLPTLGEEEGGFEEVEIFEEKIISPLPPPPEQKEGGSPAKIFQPQEQEKFSPPPPSESQGGSPAKIFYPPQGKKNFPPPPPPKRSEALIVISVPDDGPSEQEENQITQEFSNKIPPSRALVSRRVLGLEKISFLLDSGANEFMFQGRNFLQQLGTRDQNKNRVRKRPAEGRFWNTSKFCFR